MSPFERGILAFLFGWITAFSILSCVSTTYPAPMTETTLFGLRMEMRPATPAELGGATNIPFMGGNTSGPGVLDSILSTLWSFAWLIALALVLFLVVCWRFPAVRGWLTAKPLREKMAARKRLSPFPSRSPPP